MLSQCASLKIAASCFGLACAGVAGVFLAATAFAAPGTTSPPEFSPSPDVGWIAYGPEFIPVPNEHRPVGSDPAHPWVPNAIEYLSARPDAKVSEQSTFPVADLSNPILQPWAREELRKLNDRVLAGKPLDARQASCWPIGVPGFLLYPVNPVFIIQAPKEVLMIWQSDHMVRHVYLNVPHSLHVRPSWFGESVGHYEGDALVVDTIGMTTKTFIDNYRTPHTDRLHVIERFHTVEGGKTMEVSVHVEDPGAFTAPWGGMQRYARVQRAPLAEQSCAENNVNYLNQDVEPMPEAASPDF